MPYAETILTPRSAENKPGGEVRAGFGMYNVFPVKETMKESPERL